MKTYNSQFAQGIFATVTFILVLGALAMIWPGIMALFFGVLLLFQSFSAEQEIVVLSWTEVGHWSIVFTSLRRPGFQVILL